MKITLQTYLRIIRLTRSVNFVPRTHSILPKNNNTKTHIFIWLFFIQYNLIILLLFFLIHFGIDFLPYTQVPVTTFCLFFIYRIILIAQKNTVYEKFPTPLINRLEKHYVVMSSILEEWQKEVLKDFKDWIINFANIRLDDFIVITYIFICSIIF